MAVTSASHTPTLSFNALFESKNPAFPRIHMKRRLVISSIKIKTFYSKCYGKIKVGISKLGIDIGIRYFSSINIDNFSIFNLKMSNIEKSKTPISNYCRPFRDGCRELRAFTSMKIKFLSVERMEKCPW